MKKNDIVAISSHNHRDDFICCMAALCIGACYNPWFYGMNLGKSSNSEMQSASLHGSPFERQRVSSKSHRKKDIH